jgi:NitT/TauT family transport system substrate-binding protein
MRGATLRLRILGLVACVALAACAPSPPPGPTAAGPAAKPAAPAQSAQPIDVPVQLAFTPGGMAAWAYLGIDKGYFTEQGLNVTVARGTGGYSTAQNVDQGRYTIGVQIDLGSLVALRQQGPSDTRGVMILDAMSPFGLQSFADKPVATPRDFEGKTIGIQPGSIDSLFFPAFCRANGCDISKVNVVDLAGDVYVPSFLQGKVDIISGYYDGLYPPVRQAAEKQGKQLTAVWARDFGMDAYRPLLIASGKAIKEQPDVVRRFVAVAKRAYDEMAADPAVAVEAMLKLQPELDRAVALEQARNHVELAKDETTLVRGLGCANPDKLRRTAEYFNNLYQVANPVAAEQLYTAEFTTWCG